MGPSGIKPRSHSKITMAGGLRHRAEKLENSNFQRS